MAMHFAVLVVIFHCLIGPNSVESVPRYASVMYNRDTKIFDITPGRIDGAAAAWAKFSNVINETGWSSLEVHTNEAYSDEVQSRAAGMVEGYITAELIWPYYQNMFFNYCIPEAKCNRLREFMGESEMFIMNAIKENTNDKYWYQVKMVNLQFYGLIQGYIKSSIGDQTLGFFEFMFLQYYAGLPELNLALDPSKTTRYGLTPCSALVKLLPDNEELFISHNTWTEYKSMLRVYKLYDLRLVNNTNTKFHVNAQNQSFSSYPGTLHSMDDYYTLSSGLVVQETTNFNYNPDLWQYVTPHTVPQWIRTTVSNRLAASGRQWVSLFGKYNDGIYNNQWMVLDYNKFSVGQPLVPGTLWILEQLPGMVEMADMTIHLQTHGYWASYNIPYFTAIYNTSGFQTLFKKFGSYYDHEMTPRAQIFRRDHTKVRDLASMLKLMRYNDYKHDPLSRYPNCTPPYSASNTIAARLDLNPANGTHPAIPLLDHMCGGATDAKITSYTSFQDFKTLAVSSPTFDQQPVFQWSTSGWSRPRGHPDRWDFQPVMVDWGKDGHKKFDNWYYK